MIHLQNSALLFLVRHGATDANLSQPYILQGCEMDLPLNETGLEQARSLGEFFRSYQLDAIYSSGLLRARETAQQIGQYHDISLQTIPEFHEVKVGRWEGLGWDEIMSQFPREYAAFMENPADVPYLGGESYRDVLQRVHPVLIDLLRENLGKKIVVVAHNVVNRVILADLLGIDLNRAKDIRQSNCGVNVIRYQPEEIELLTMNAFFHLGYL